MATKLTLKPDGVLNGTKLPIDDQIGQLAILEHVEKHARALVAPGGNFRKRANNATDMLEQHLSKASASNSSKGTLKRCSK